MSDYRVESVKRLHELGFAELEVCSVGEVEARDEAIATQQARITELEQQLSTLEDKIYDAYGLGIMDGEEMERHPLGLGGKTKHQVIVALLQESSDE